MLMLVLELTKHTKAIMASVNEDGINDDKRTTTLYAETVKIRKFEDPSAFQKDVEYLDSCGELSESCVSTTNDDEAHFINPWGFSMSKAQAMKELCEVAIGNKGGEGYFEYNTSKNVVGNAIARSDKVRGGSVGIEAMRKKARESALRDLQMESSKEDDLEPPKMMTGPLGDCLEYDVKNGKIVLRLFDRKVGEDEIIDDESEIFDAEFYFLENDSIVDVRVAARDAPKGGVFAISYDQGLKFEKNRARALADNIRQKLGWEIVPVIASFDPKWDSKRRLWFEDILDPTETRGEWNSASWVPDLPAIIEKIASKNND
jgi:hypothetical protein